MRVGALWRPGVRAFQEERKVGVEAESESCSAPRSISKEAGGLSEVNVGVGREVGGEALSKIAQGPVDH